MPLALISFDVEEFDLPLERGQAISDEEQFEVSRTGLVSVLDLLDRLNVTATFFITAHFALHHPDLIQRLARRHEVASHGYRHDRFENADLARSKAVLEQISGQVVVGFRRARMGDTDPQALATAGYRYDSSDNPTWIPGRYNHFSHLRRPHRIGPVVEVPASVTPIIRLPLFWLSFKNLPLPLFRGASAWTLAVDGHVNLYFHPWEFADLSAFSLPGYISRPDGPAMLLRLERYLAWLARRSRFATVRDFVVGL